MNSLTQDMRYRQSPNEVCREISVLDCQALDLSWKASDSSVEYADMPWKLFDSIL